MRKTQSLHSVCRWTFHAGKGGFTPGNIRPSWQNNTFSTPDMIRLVKEKIQPFIPENIQLGIELHYDYEVNEKNISHVKNAFLETGLHLAMITPGAHQHFGYGGIISIDPHERKLAEEFGKKTVDLAYELKSAWNQDKDKYPSFVLWNGSYGYDLASIAIQKMYNHLKESIADLCRYEEKKGGNLFFAIEPKPNEGHPAMIIPTVASALVFWNKLNQEYQISLEKKGVNKEFGHTEMIGLDHVYDTVEEIDNQALIHMHLNSQGYNDGIIYGGPGKYDIDHGARINGMNIAIAGLIQKSGYNRWKGHDMQPRPYDNENQAIDRVIRSIISWEACEHAAEELDENQLMNYLQKRETAKAEDIIRNAVSAAQQYFNHYYTRTY